LQEQLDNLQAEGNVASYPEPASREYKLAEVVIVDEDELVMDRLMKFLEQRIDDDSLRIDDMAEAVNMGRTVFYEKIRQLVGVSPSDFLRQVRMQRARQLIAKSNMNISQVAYAVGFSDPKYFAKCFKKEFGVLPSEYLESLK
jgi:AraC-like DNA-binding protein